MSWLELKILPPLVTLITGTLMWALAQVTPQFLLLGQFSFPLAIMIAGAGGMLMFIAAYLFFTARTTINPMHPENSSTLVTTGLYRFTRNPIYLGDLLVLVGWGFYVQNIFSLALIFGFVFYMNRFQIIPEERALSAHFGDEYTDFLNRVSRWI